LTALSAERVVINDGEVHACGRMPNSIMEGWWLVGTVAEVEQTAAGNRPVHVRLDFYTMKGCDS